jgi:hypothetical protein
LIFKTEDLESFWRSLTVFNSWRFGWRFTATNRRPS